MPCSYPHPHPTREDQERYAKLAEAYYGPGGEITRCEFCGATSDPIMDDPHAEGCPNHPEEVLRRRGEEGAP